MIKNNLSIYTHIHKYHISIYIWMHVYDVKYHVYDIKYYRTNTEHIDYINRFNDNVRSNTVLYAWDTQNHSVKLKLKNKLVMSKLISLLSQKILWIIWVPWYLLWLDLWSSTWSTIANFVCALKNMCMLFLLGIIFYKS